MIYADIKANNKNTNMANKSKCELVQGLLLYLCFNVENVSIVEQTAEIKTKTIVFVVIFLKSNCKFKLHWRFMIIKLKAEMRTTDLNSCFGEIIY